MELGKGADLRGGKKMVPARREREGGGARVAVDPLCVLWLRDRDWLDAKGGERGLLDLFCQEMNRV